MEEIWKDIIGYEGIYQVSNTGLVKSLDRDIKCKNGAIKKRKGALLKPWVTPQGYNVVSLGRYNKQTVHRLVAQAFIPNPDNKPCVNHKDGNKLNNNDYNLEWSTHSENNSHAYATGLKTSHVGRWGTHPRAKKVLDIITGTVYDSAKHASESIGINPGTLRDWLRGKRPNKTNFRYL